MAAPTALTLSTLVAEALKKAGQTSPDSTLVTRAESYWMEEIKNDIWSRQRKLKSLYAFSSTVLTNGKDRYSNPSDYASDMSMVLIDGTHRDTAQSATAGSITLAVTEDVSDPVGSEIFIRSATAGAGGIGTIVAYNSTTKVATISPNWVTTPTGTITYTIVDSYRSLTEKPAWEYQPNISRERGLPVAWYPIGDADCGEFILDPVPYQSDAHAMGVLQRYFANLMTLDLAGTLIGTLYNNWKQVFTLGIKYRALDELNDRRWESAYKEYQLALSGMIARETLGQDMSNLQMKVKEE